MPLNRRDLLKTAAVAAVPGSLLLDAVYGGVLPPEVVPEDSPPEETTSEDLKSSDTFYHKLLRGEKLVFLCGYSRLMIEAHEVVKVYKSGCKFTLCMGDFSYTVFGKTDPLNSGNTLGVFRQGRQHWLSGFGMRPKGKRQFFIHSLSQDQYVAAIAKCGWRWPSCNKDTCGRFYFDKSFEYGIIPS